MLDPVVVGVVVVAANAVGNKGAAVLELDLQSSSLEEGKAPTALLALAFDVLATHSSPEKVVVGESLPALRYLSGASERDGVEVAENA